MRRKLFGHLLVTVLSGLLLVACYDDPEPVVPSVGAEYYPECGAFIIQDGDTLDLSGQTLFMPAGEKVIEFDMYYFGPYLVEDEDVVKMGPATCASTGEVLHIEEEYLTLSMFSFQEEDFKISFSRPEGEVPYVQYWSPVRCNEPNGEITAKLFQRCPMYKRHLRVEFLSDEPPVKSDGFLVELNLSTFRYCYNMSSIFKIYATKE